MSEWLPQKLEEFGRAVLLKDLPHAGLVAGDIGVIVDVYKNGEAYEVEFMTALGETVGVETLESSDVRLPRRDEVLHICRADRPGSSEPT